MSIPKPKIIEIGKKKKKTFVKFCLHFDYHGSKINIVSKPTKTRIEFHEFVKKRQ